MQKTSAYMTKVAEDLAQALMTQLGVEYSCAGHQELLNSALSSVNEDATRDFLKDLDKQGKL